MAEQALLPPHQASAAPVASAATPYNAQADAQALDAAEPQDYGTEPDPAPTPGAGAAGADAPPGTGDMPGGDAPPPDPNQRAKDSARELIETYDFAQSMGWSYMAEVPEATPEKFQLSAFPKDRAIHHLARGMEKMGSPEIPWWIALLMVLAVPAVANYFAAKEFRKGAEAKAREARENNKRRQEQGQPLSPDSITTKKGEHFDLRPVPSSASANNTSSSSTAATGRCGMCAKPTKKGRKFCSQSCAGKATRKPKK